MNMFRNCRKNEHIKNIGQNEEEKYDRDLQDILHYIAKHPKSSEYMISKETHINRIKVSRKIHDQYNLIERGILKLEKGKRNANLYSLKNFRSLHYCLHINAISEKEAYEIMKTNNISLPKVSVSDENEFIFNVPLFSIIDRIFNVREGEGTLKLLNFFMEKRPQFAEEIFTRLKSIRLVEEPQYSNVISGILGLLAIKVLSKAAKEKKEELYVFGEDEMPEDLKILFERWRRFEKELEKITKLFLGKEE